MPRPSISQTPAQVSKSLLVRQRHHRSLSVPPSRVRLCVTVRVGVGHWVSLRATQRGDTDLISGLLPLAVPPLFLPHKKSLSPHQRGKFGGRRLALLRSLRKFHGCAVEPLLLFLCVCHALSQNKLYEPGKNTCVQLNLNTCRIDWPYVEQGRCPTLLIHTLIST